MNIGTLFLILIFGACSMLDTHGQAVAEPVSDGLPRSEDFDDIVRQYPYRAPAARRAKIVSGFTWIAPCMLRKDIATLMGHPDDSQIDFGPKGPGEKWIGSSWTYYLEKQSAMINEHDAKVEINFDTENRVVWATSYGFDGAREVGNVQGKCRFTIRTPGIKIGVRS
jgi:hypothetical protein